MKSALEFNLVVLLVLRRDLSVIAVKFVFFNVVAFPAKVCLSSVQLYDSGG